MNKLSKRDIVAKCTSEMFMCIRNMMVVHNGQGVQMWEDIWPTKIWAYVHRFESESYYDEVPVPRFQGEASGPIVS